MFYSFWCMKANKTLDAPINLEEWQATITADLYPIKNSVHSGLYTAY